ncbi:SMP-30/gluconolactonase/LRE family protein [Maribacter halichondriae]|uniref:SMP-30/gluconolactonase/LRE family protein n=1 Tax=Maribacter halichondriae TaxID=2980554 RepID=UPI0023595BDC|nr:SMP-30/gluconolactonase/LRE family protein [Maribacter sp. Hal144]
MNFFPKIFKTILFGIFNCFVLISCKAQKIASTDFVEEFAFTKGIEGPAVDAAGNLYAVNFKEDGTIGIVDSKGNTEIFLRLPGKSIGNGIRFDQTGNMFIADYVGHNVYRVEKGEGTPEVFAHNPEMSQPNDLAIAPNGTIYLSDPNWAENSGRIWRVGKDQKITLLEENMGTTNGIEVSPDGKTLYVNESVQRNVWKYEINADGSLSNKTKFMEFKDFGMDGMRCDAKGNLYITRYDKGTVVIASPEGKIIKEVKLKGKKPSNITFGGRNGKTCFVTMADRGCFESFTALNEGNYYNQVH